ncbi:TraM recognition domain-containing protein (plasmid) [Hymenobacter sp. NBH84]|uniref:conjugal transfer protein MobC n=1 Tax=Hymenobacter sp. NBH84 TaxID=2596915 RepID=UPI0016263A87|nr:conjugal transfer protein MobC [Hymenobacter sp. NBH84]QNE42179.1 TraM recognition domain-containing protein [Hymenobacter sp. NBH84]
MEDERGMRKIMDFMRLISLLLVLVHVYYYCYGYFVEQHLTAGWLEKLLTRFSTKTALFHAPYVTKAAAAVFLMLSCLGTRGKPNEHQTWKPIAGYFLAGLVVFFGNGWLLAQPYTATALATLYVSTTATGYLLLLRAGNTLGRLLKVNLMGDIFNAANESFPQEERNMPNEYSVNLPTTYQLRGKQRRGWVNIVNPFRGTVVYGTPGSGKSFAVINQFIKQHLAKGFAMYVYDFKFDDLSRIVYNELLKNQDKYAQPVRFYVINFDNPRKSHRCNPLLPSMMTDIVDAYESAATIMLNLNKKWIEKQGEFFVESPINFVAAIIWFLKLYEKGKYCTFPHVIEFLGREYQEMFPILGSYPEIENYVRPFISAFEGDAMEQLEGQIASARIPLSRLASPQLYWVMSGNDFTLDINNPEEPKVLCVGNNPDREVIYGAALGLYNARLVKLVNKKGKLKTSIIIDELPTIYFKGLDKLIATARSNKVSTCLGIQDKSQLDRDYGKAESAVIQNTIGNVIAGQVTGESAEALSKRFGRIVQRRQSVSINSRDTSNSISTQLDSMIPASKISNLTQGTFVGAVADNFGEEIEQKVFHARIMVDVAKVKAEEAAYEEIPDITNFRHPETGEDQTEEVIRRNYKSIKDDIALIVQTELSRIAADPDLLHLIKNNKAKAK